MRTTEPVVEENVLEGRCWPTSDSVDGTPRRSSDLRLHAIETTKGAQVRHTIARFR